MINASFADTHTSKRKTANNFRTCTLYVYRCDTAINGAYIVMYVWICYREKDESRWELYGARVGGMVRKCIKICATSRSE